MHQWNFWPFFQHGPVIEIWFFKQNCKIAYVLALPEDICAILMKFVIHILKALDISYWKMQEKVEIITNHIVHFWTKIFKNGYCTVLHFISERLSPRFLPQNQIKFLSVKKFYFRLTAFCLAIDNLETNDWKISICWLFSGHVFSIIKSHHRPI